MELERVWDAEVAVVSRQAAAVKSGIGHGPQQRPAHPVARIHLLGAMRATSYLGDDILPRGKKSRAMLAYLCFAFGTKVPRARLAAMLWDSANDEQARASCRQALSELCSALGPLAAELIAPRRASVRLNVSSCWVDALALMESASPSSADLAAICSSELLEGLEDVSPQFDRWLDRERDRLRQRVKSLREDQRSCRLVSYAHQHLPNHSRFRVAVLPFDAIDLPGEQHLAVSLSYGVAGALARLRWLDVVSPLSALFRPLANVTTNELIERKRLDYIVDGGISRHGQNLLVDIRLLDLAHHGDPVWRESFHLTSSELHRLNEMVTAKVIGSIDPVILFIENHAGRRENFDAASLLLLAIPLLYSVEPKKFRRAGKLIEQSLAIDPENATALAWAALWQITVAAEGWVQNIVEPLAKAEALCLKALQIDPDNAEALGVYAHTCAWNKDLDAAVRYFDRSLRVNPNLPFIWALSATTSCYIGDPDAALRRLKRYRELAPFEPDPTFEGIYAIAYTLKGQYERAVLVGRRAVKANPQFTASYKPLIASLGHLGRPDEAKPYIEKLQSLHRNFTVERFAQTYPLQQPSDRERYCEGLRLAGVAER